jgi:outer membrane biogenesis lipoprotein LolB
MRSSVRSRLLLATVAALVLAACQSDELGSPETTPQRT